MKGQLQEMASALRVLAADMVHKAQSGHAGLPLGAADIVSVLMHDFLKFNPETPSWFNRDRFVLSAGHGSAMLYAMLYLAGYPLTLEDLRQFRKLGSQTPGHPEYAPDLGIETTTGPLGQGLGNAVGIALEEKHLEAVFGKEVIDYHTVVLAGDGDLMEGLSHEVAPLAVTEGLHKLIVLHDDNRITIDGSTDLARTSHPLERFAAYGFVTQRADGHNSRDIKAKLAHAFDKPGPHFISFRTTIGLGIDWAGTCAAHGTPPSEEQMAQLRKNLHWDFPPFEVPPVVLKTWRQCWERNRADYTRSLTHQGTVGARIKARSEQRLPASCGTSWANQPMATRKASQKTLEEYVAHNPPVLLGTADLASSTGMAFSSLSDFTDKTPEGVFIRYGIREHGMAAMMNGISLGNMTIPVGSTFLSFADYLRPALRLSALMERQVVYVFTHDGIGVGEDGPTHQPIEQLAGLQIIPNLMVLRPADTWETVACWDVILRHTKGPSAILLSRQSLPVLWKERPNLETGALVLKGDPKTADVTLMASGSEVSLAMQVASQLTTKGTRPLVVSVPILKRFLQQPEAVKSSTLGGGPRLVVEAAELCHWRPLLREGDALFGLSSFGMSGPAEQVYHAMGLSTEAIVKKSLELLGH